MARQIEINLDTEKFEETAAAVRLCLGQCADAMSQMGNAMDMMLHTLEEIRTRYEVPEDGIVGKPDADTPETPETLDQPLQGEI